MNRLAAVVSLLLLAMASQGAYSDTPADAPSSAGEALFKSHCESCHSRFLGSRAPSRQMLARYSPRAIIQALTTGLMRVQGYSLSGDQRRAIAEYVRGVTLEPDLAGESRGRCDGNPPMAAPALGPQWNGWANSQSNWSFQPAAAAELTVAEVKALKLK